MTKEIACLRNIAIAFSLLIKGISIMTEKTPIQQALKAYRVDEAVAPEEFRVIEISFYDHEIYDGDKLIASITYDDDDF
ncbi:MAG: hypothetical protein ACIWVG_25665, partial [Gloeotrichia echinulata HAB0833]